MRAYLDLLRQTLDAPIRSDRTGVGTRSLFAQALSFDMNEGFPLVTSKKIYIRSLIYELLWFLRGENNVSFLRENNVKIWDAWADSKGNLGPTYGVQWRCYPKGEHHHVDQIARAIEMLKNDPYSRRIVVSAWNPAQIDQMALPPCHCLFQFYVDNQKRLSCSLYQRSADIFLGIPFNIASYALLTAMMAQVTNLIPYMINIFFGDVHLYENHIEQAKTQLARKPRKRPKLALNKNIQEIDLFTFDDISIINYDHASALPAPIAV